MTAPKDMFLPGGRSEWTMMVRPPPDYRLVSAVGTTYGLDFTALTAVLLALLNQSDDRVAWEDHARLLQAITRLSENVRVLVQRAQVHAEVKQSNKVFALFDQMVDEVSHKNGNFHPKVWAFKYSPRRPVDVEEVRVGKAKKSPPRDDIYRLLCTSRNLTLNSNWEAVICLEGRIKSHREDGSTGVGRSVADFFEAAFDPSNPIPKAISALVHELKQVTFSTDGSKAVQSCEFLWQRPGKAGLFQDLDEGGKSALFISPFVRRGFLERLAKKFEKLIVVSRQEELDAFWDDALQRLIPLDNVWVVKTGDGDDRAGESPPLELHAKLLFCEYGMRGTTPAHTEVWLGSANATPSAWGLHASTRFNSEAMVRFRPGIRPEQFLEHFAYRDVDGEVLNGWISRYQPGDVDEPDEEAKAEKSLDELKCKIAAQSLQARFERSDQSIRLTLETSEPARWAELFELHPEFQFEICPLGLSDGWPFRNLREIAVGGIAFEQLTMAQVGSFVMIRLTHYSTMRSKSFAVKATTEVDEDFWDARRMAFLRENLNAKDFREFLRSILFENTPGTDRVNPENDPMIEGGKLPANKITTRHGSFLDDFAVEDILNACTKDRSRIDEIDKLLRDFAGTDHVDVRFLTFWDNFREAMSTTEKAAES